MKKPSRHYLVYDARTYAEQGFLELSGKVRKMAQKPRYWHVKATAHTQDPATGEQRKHEFNFRPRERCRLSELSDVINQRIHEEDDFAPDCVSVIVKACILKDGK